MKTAQKLFGNAHLPHVLDDEDKIKILDDVLKKSGISIPEKSVTKSKLISNNNINQLEKGYLAIAVPNELKIYLYFTTLRGIPKTFIILRELTPGFAYPKIISLSSDVILNDDVFNGTLIEATRAYIDRDRYVVLMTDLKVYKGSTTDVRKKDFVSRLATLGTFMKNEYNEILKKFPFRLQIVTPYSHLSLIEQRIKNLPYKISKIEFVSHDSKHSNLHFPII